jgi:hypothetical protein
VGAWVWANQETTIQAPGLSYLDSKQTEQMLTRPVTVGTTPTFVATHLDVPADFSRLFILLDPGDSPGGAQPIVYYSGIVLAEGQYPTNTPPVFRLPDGKGGTWDGATFTNLARNALVSQAWPYPRPAFVAKIGNRISLGQTELTQVMDTLLDFHYTQWYFQATAKSVFQTFWAKFGWGRVRLWHKSAYYLLLFITLFGLLGAATAGIRHRARLIQPANVFLALALLAVVSFAILYNLIYASVLFHAFIPVARYIYPAILPIVLVLNLGWLEMARMVSRRRPFPSRWTAYAYVALFLALDVYSIVSIIRYFMA